MEIFASKKTETGCAPGKQIIIFYEHLSREYDAIIDLKNALMCNPDTDCCVVVAQVNLEWRKAISYARMNGVDSLVLPGYYAMSPDSFWTIPFKNINPDVSIINLHHEQIPAALNKSAQLPHDPVSKNGCIHIAWTDNFRASLENVGVRPDLIHVTGSPRADLLVTKEAKTHKADLANRFGLDEGKKWIIYCDNRFTSNRDAIRGQAKNTIYREVSRELYERKELLDEKTRELLLDQMDDLPDSFFEEFELILRPHPGTVMDRQTNRRVHVIDEGPIGLWLHVVDLVLVWNSTTAFEADVLGVPAVRHEPIPNEKMFRAIGLEDYPCIQSLNQIDDRFLDETKRMCLDNKSFRMHYGDVDGKSAERIARVILDSIQSPPRLEAVPSTFAIKKDYAVFALRNAVGSFILSVGLLEAVKWPKAAYVHRNELRNCCLPK